MSPQLMGEAKSATDDVLGVNDYPPDKLDLQTRVGMLNADQRRGSVVYDELTSNEHQKTNLGYCT